MIFSVYIQSTIGVVTMDMFLLNICYCLKYMSIAFLLNINKLFLWDIFLKVYLCYIVLLNKQHLA